MNKEDLMKIRVKLDSIMKAYKKGEDLRKDEDWIIETFDTLVNFAIGKKQKNSEIKTINLGKDFSRYPSGIDDGRRFRNVFLLPILQRNEKAIINLDDTRGIASNFIKEAFGELVNLGFSKEVILTTFVLKSSDISLVNEILQYFV